MPTTSHRPYSGESADSLPAHPQKKRLGERLIEAGFLTQTHVDLALREQKRKGGLIGQILVNLGFVVPEVIADFVAKEAEAKVVNITRQTIDKAVLDLLPFEMAKRLVALPFGREGNTLTVALSDPSNISAIDALQQFTGLAVDVVTAPERDILNSL